jgi:hypothetical protein
MLSIPFKYQFGKVKMSGDSQTLEKKATPITKSSLEDLVDFSAFLLQFISAIWDNKLGQISTSLKSDIKKTDEVEIDFVKTFIRTMILPKVDDKNKAGLNAGLLVILEMAIQRTATKK